MIEDNIQPDQTQTPTPTAFCQNCGRPLTPETLRNIGPAVYCEPCFTARTSPAGSGPAAGQVPPPYANVNAGPYVPPADWATPIPTVPGSPNPGLATLLGFIPGAGAMYNGQYAKGIVHLVIFVILVSLADTFGPFGILVAGWVIYMAIEAHHTARARRDGLPLPNPFGLNDIGERLGFDKNFGQGVDFAGAARDAAQTVAHAVHQPGSGPAAPQNSGQNPYPGYPPYGAPYVQPPYTPSPYTQAPYTPVEPVPTMNPYENVAPIPVVTGPARFPAGAVWLIGLGLFFLLLTTGRFEFLQINFTGLLGFGLVALGLWSFYKRMADSGPSLTPTPEEAGTPNYAIRAFQAARGAVWLIAFGTWFLLNTFHIARLSRSWPIFIILAGLMTLTERAIANRAFAAATPTDSSNSPKAR